MKKSPPFYHLLVSALLFLACCIAVGPTPASAVEINVDDIIVLSNGYYRIDPLTRETTKIMNIFPLDIAVEPDGDLIILSKETPPQIYHIDATTSARTVIAAGTQGTSATAFSSMARAADGTLYLIEPKTSPFSGNLYEVNLITGEPMLLGVLPYANEIEVAPDGFIYAFTNGVGEDLHIVDPTDGTDTTLSISSGAFSTLDGVERVAGIAFAPNGDIYAIGKRVGSAAEGTLVRIDPETGDQQEIVSVADEIRDGSDLVRTPAGNFYMTMDNGGLPDEDLFYEIDGGNGAIAAFLNGDYSPIPSVINKSLVLDPNGDVLFVAADYAVPFGRSLTGAAITVVLRVKPSTDARSVEAGTAVTFGVRQLALEPTGTMVGSIINSPNPQTGIVRFDLETGNVDGVTQDDIIDDPVGIAVDPASGTLFVSDKADEQYVRVDPDTGIQALLGTLADPTFTGGGLAFDTIDDSLVTTLPFSFATPGVARFDSPGGSAQVPANVATGAPFIAPGFITLGPNGDIFVADVSSHSVIKVVRATGVASTLTAGPPFSGLAGLEYSASLDTLLVADRQGGAIYEVDPDTGAHSVFVDINDFPGAPIFTPLDLIVVDAVPEASALANHLAALGVLIGLVSRNRRLRR